MDWNRVEGNWKEVKGKVKEKKKGERDPIQLRNAGLRALGLDSEGKWTR
jgi:hypothetical protein